MREILIYIIKLCTLYFVVTSEVQLGSQLEPVTAKTFLNEKCLVNTTTF